MIEKSGRVYCLYLTLILFLFSGKFLHPEVRFKNWRFDNNYKKKRIFLQSFVNYELDPSWQIEWQRNLFRQNALRLAFGSVSVKNLNSSIEAVINYDLGNGWYFRAESNKIKQKMKYELENNIFLGFEKKIYKQFSLYSQCNPTYDKEDIDILLGLSLMNDPADNYFRLALTYDDFLYDEKNPSGGKVVSEPLGIKWDVNLYKNKFLLSSSGKIENCFEVDFPDSSLSAERYSFNNKNDEFEIWLYYLFTAGHIAEVDFYHYYFRQSEKFYEQTSDYEYKDHIYDLALKYNHLCHPDLMLKTALHIIGQQAEAEGQRDYNFKRNELIPSIILEFRGENTFWEFGYIRNSYELNLDDNMGSSSYRRERSFQTLMIRWTYNFNAFARLQFSMSHVPDIEGAGAGNVNFLLLY